MARVFWLPALLARPGRPCQLRDCRPQSRVRGCGFVPPFRRATHGFSVCNPSGIGGAVTVPGSGEPMNRAGHAPAIRPADALGLPMSGPDQSETQAPGAIGVQRAEKLAGRHLAGQAGRIGDRGAGPCPPRRSRQGPSGRPVSGRCGARWNLHSPAPPSALTCRATQLTGRAPGVLQKRDRPIRDRDPWPTSTRNDPCLGDASDRNAPS